MDAHARRSSQVESGPNMTPMVDIVLVILIFLMLSAVMTAEHFLPARWSGGPIVAPPIDQPTVDVMVVRTSNGFVASAGNLQTSDPQVLTEHLKALRQRLSPVSGGKEVRLSIYPMGNVRHESLMQVHEAAMGAGYTNIAYATSPKRGQ